MSAPVASFVNHYAVLGVDQKANVAAIEQAYKALSAEFHPDNRKTGDAEKFKAVQTAYDLLSNPVTRADFDKLTAPVTDDFSFPAAEFLGSFGEDSARRLCLLCILYHRLKNNPISPVIPLRVITELMVISELDMEFSIWYLKKRGLLTTDDKSRLLITVAGIDYVENVGPTVEMIRSVLRNPPAMESGSGPSLVVVESVATGATRLGAAPGSVDAPVADVPAEQTSAANATSITALSKVLAKLGNVPRAPAPLQETPAEEQTPR